MYFNNLVEDILVLVLEHSIDESGLDIGAWKRKLELLQVCSQWRKLLVPKVYADVVVRAGTEDSRRGRYWLMENWNNGYLNIVFTNANLMTSNHLQHMARRLLIYPTCIYNNVYGVDEVLGLLGMYSQVWPTINTISILISRKKITVNTPIFTFDTFGGLAKEVADNMFRMFPLAKRLCLTNKSSSFNGDYMFKKIVQSYSEQVSWLVTDRELLKNIVEFPAHLTHLNMPMTHKPTRYMPKIYAASLKFLRLTEVPQNYRWKCFIGADSNGSICFSNLKVLEITYSIAFNAPMVKRKCRHHQRPIKFFSLQRLSIEGRFGHCCILECSKFFGPLKDLRIAGPASNINVLSENMLQTSSITLAIDERSGLTDARLMSILNGIGKRSNAQISNIYAKRNDIFIDPVQLLYFSLTNLVIHAPTDARQLLVYLEKFPCLERVGLKSVTFRHIHKDALLVRSGTFIDQPLEPLDARVHSIYLKFNYYGESAQKVDAFLAYLLLRTTRMRQFAADADALNNVGHIIDDYMPFYRHLQDIKLINVNCILPGEFLL
ncbi:hypothetical protein BX667DRAFT_149676 [Coemansia mojavensis]|nr:hypothetical protein BX667DRAFT_149676 [Coemansia mojavensis]